MVAQRRKGLLFATMIAVPFSFLVGPAPGQQPQNDNKEERRDISSYREFLVQAEQALQFAKTEQTAHDILDLCPKHLRHFEWHYLYRKAHQVGFFLKGHTDVVRAVAFSPDNKILASAGDDQTIKLWDRTSGKMLHNLRIRGWEVLCVAFHPDGKTLVSGGRNQAVKLWDVASGKELATLSKHNSIVTKVVFSPDGAWLASLTLNDVIHILDLAKVKKQKELGAQITSHTCMRFSNDGNYMVSGDNDGKISLWSVPRFRLVKQFPAHLDMVTDLAFHPDGKRLITSGLDGFRVWEFPEGKLLKSITRPDETQIHALALNHDGTALATIGEKKAKLWYEPLDKPAREFNLSRPIRLPFFDKPFIALAPNGQTLAIEGNEFTIRLIDVAEQTLQIQAAEPIWSVHPAKDHFLVSMRKGAAAISVGPDGTQQQRDLKGHKGQVRTVCYQPDGNLMASAGLDRLVKIWDRRADKEIHSLAGHQGLIRHLAFSPDGKRLASAGEDKTVKIWDPVAGKELLTLKDHKGSVTSVVFLPKDQLASAGGDGAIMIWDAVTGKNLKTITAHHDWISSLVLSADGKRLASAGLDKKIKVWDATGKLQQTISASTSMVQALAFSPDGKRLASGNLGGGVTLWDPVVGQEVYTFPRLTGPVNAVAFSPDGATLFSGSYDGTIMLWKARPME